MREPSELVVYSLGQQRAAIIFLRLRLIKLVSTGYIENPFTHEKEAIVHEFTSTRFVEWLLRKLVLLYHDKYARESEARLIQYGYLVE